MMSKTASLAQGKKRRSAKVASVFLLVVSLFVLAGSLVFTTKQAQIAQFHITDANELRVLSQQIAKNATEAAEGKAEAFVFLKDARNDFDSRYNRIKQSSLEKSPFSIVQAPQPISLINAIDAAWSALKVEADNILVAEEKVASLHRVAINLEETIPHLQIEYDEVIERLLVGEVAADQIALAQRQPWLAERIVKAVRNILKGGESSIVAADSLYRDTKLFSRVLTGMTEGNVAIGIQKVTNEETVDRLLEIADFFAFVSGSVDDILEASPELFQVHKAADQIFTDSQQLLQQTSMLANSYKNNSQASLWGQLFVIISGAMVLISLLLLAVSINREARNRLKVSKAQSDANQAAIIRLLDEVAELADGNLTVHATVTEDFTGAIADSINDAIEQLRILVKTINQTAVEVDNAAQETQSTAHKLAEASEHQASEISTATQSINEMALSVNGISVHAADSACVAQRSLTIATNGAGVVRNAIDGMNTIRNQIQDTSKRLKRLGESSQEIGNIVSLINDIADQTNILFLNASIQASMAGESGRGFAVVTDEVQRLSERVTGATKQIETLVSTIQANTNEAVLSMEQTTAEVVKGAELTQHAGVALEEIEDVSSSLAKLIQNISDTAKTQAESAAQISSRMKVIKDITIQTSSGTNATAGSIGNLAEMALEMRKTVSGFRLQETEN